MSDKKNNLIFQDKANFEVDQHYETFRLVGDTVIENSQKYLGTFVSAITTGFGDGCNTCSTFNLDGKHHVHKLEYDGSTRYRKVSGDTRLQTIGASIDLDLKNKYAKYKNKYMNLKKTNI